MKRFILIVSCLIVAGIGITSFVSYKITHIINGLQADIERQALPVLRAATPLLDGELLRVVPGAQGLLDRVGFGPFNAGKITKGIVRTVSRPLVEGVVESQLEKTRHQLNEELTLVKIHQMTYDNTHGQKTIVAHCSYGITVTLTGRRFNRIIKSSRNMLAITFTCD